MNMKQKILLGLFLSVALAGILKADESDDTLKYYLSKSDLVAVGTISPNSLAIIDALGVPNYICVFQIKKVIKGDSQLEGKNIRVNIMRFEIQEKDKSPLIKNGGECILFLKNVRPRIPSWETVDFWFGVQNYSPWMAKSLERIEKD